MPITREKQYGFWDSFFEQEQGGGADVGLVGGTCTDHTGLLGKKGAKVSCADLKAAQEGKEAGTYTAYTGQSKGQRYATKSATASTSEGIKSGNYKENDYIYRYDAKTGSITIVASPSGSTNTSVPKDGSAYKAILGVIKSGKAKLVPESAVKQVTASKAPAPVSSAAIIQGAEKATKTPFYKETWFLIGAPVTAAVVLGLAIILWPRAPAGK
ncbi:MAG: hypothetical protein CMD33_01040 [Flavobacteriales bacterium]|nr:hypothetical protein [Flavobacteriales bacterium]